MWSVAADRLSLRVSSHVACAEPLGLPCCWLMASFSFWLCVSVSAGLGPLGAVGLGSGFPLLVALSGSLGPGTDPSF